MTNKLRDLGGYNGTTRYQRYQSRHAFLELINEMIFIIENKGNKKEKKEMKNRNVNATMHEL